MYARGAPVTVCYVQWWWWFRESCGHWPLQRRTTKWTHKKRTRRWNERVCARQCAQQDRKHENWTRIALQRSEPKPQNDEHTTKHGRLKSEREREAEEENASTCDNFKFVFMSGSDVCVSRVRHSVSVRSNWVCGLCTCQDEAREAAKIRQRLRLIRNDRKLRQMQFDRLSPKTMPYLAPMTCILQIEQQEQAHSALLIQLKTAKLPLEENPLDWTGGAPFE